MHGAFREENHIEGMKNDLWLTTKTSSASPSSMPQT